MMTLLAFLLVLATTTVIFQLGKAAGADIERRRMISAFWAYLSIHAGGTSVQREHQHLTPRERETFDGALDEIVARRGGRK